MIPKVIRYCWFGYNLKPELAEKCIRSWMSDTQRKEYQQRAKSERIAHRFGVAASKVYEVYFWSKKSNGGLGLITWCIRRLRRC